MNCHECIHRRLVPGDSHSACEHPNVSGQKAFFQMMNIVTGLPLANGVRLNEHGVRNGWCDFPLNFDPLWIDNCDGFEAKTL